jgi:hypothetical protein
MVYAAMDVHRKRSQIAILDDHGKEVLNRNVSNRLEELMVPLGSLEPGTPVAFEACYGWGWVVELLDELELEPHLAHPSPTRRSPLPASKTTRSTPAPSPTCCAPISSRRRG